jgi:lactam utilization protein B
MPLLGRMPDFQLRPIMGVLKTKMKQQISLDAIETVESSAKTILVHSDQRTELSLTNRETKVLKVKIIGKPQIICSSKRP